MTDKFGMLYMTMATSNEPKYMHIFGETMKKMMAWYIENRPEAAEEYIEELCSIKWRQYLTMKEATEAVEAMEPQAPWNYDTWEKAMETLHLEMERESVFNRYALWAAMNQIYTDFGDSIARMMGEPLEKIAVTTLVPFVQDMAVSLLTDADRKYDIREYHL